ncbi:MAG: cytochrome oxidase putative small subunit CydP [Thauera sp.]|jgi:low temperature requirement protein LtrA
MNPTDRRLVREITLVIVLKLILITALWWAFIGDAMVAVDPGAMAARIVAPASAQQHTTSGETHGQ